MTDRPDLEALALLEIDGMPRAIRAQDAALKRAPTLVLACAPVSPGKAVLILAGEVAVVEESLKEAEGIVGTRRLDRLFLPGKFCCFVYGDNEGYLSTIPSIATVMFGVLCGHLLRSSWTQRRKLQVLVGGGFASLAIGLLWGLKFPIITRLWTSSYTVFANGWAMLIFALFYWIIDVKGYRKWAFPFEVVGLNSITIYVIQNIFNFLYVANVFVGGLSNHVGIYRELLVAFSVLTVKWLFLYFLYRQKIFLKV